MMIQDIAPHVYHNEYHPAAPQGNSFLLYYEEGMVLLSADQDGEISYPRFSDLTTAPVEGTVGALREPSRFLFTIDGIGYFLAAARPVLKEEAEAEFHMEKIAVFRHARPKHQSFAGITGYQLWDWYRSNQYCGRCGHRLRHADNERMMFCEACKNTIYPKISPAVIVGVLDGDRILMTKYSGRDYKRYALIAGFNEIGESIEETVRREVMEEVGLTVKNIRYYKSQPWSFSETLLLGFYCDLDGDDTIRLDTDELSVGEWIRREDIPETVDWLSLTNEMIIRFQKGLE